MKILSVGNKKIYHILYSLKIFNNAKEGLHKKFAPRSKIISYATNNRPLLVVHIKKYEYKIPKT